LHNTIKPVGLTLNKYLSDNYPKLSWIAHKLLRKKLDRMNYKYFEGHRSKATFERYKTYHLLVSSSRPEQAFSSIAWPDLTELKNVLSAPSLLQLPGSGIRDKFRGTRKSLCISSSALHFKLEPSYDSARAALHCGAG